MAYHQETNAGNQICEPTLHGLISDTAKNRRIASRGPVVSARYAMIVLRGLSPDVTLELDVASGNPRQGLVDLFGESAQSIVSHYGISCSQSGDSRLTTVAGTAKGLHAFIRDLEPHVKARKLTVYVPALTLISGVG